MVTVKWMPRAKQDLHDIYIYFCQVKKNKQTAMKIKDTLIESSRILITFPLVGALEPFLEGETICYRYLLVDKHYKLIYFVEHDVVSIVTVFDCRQSPLRLNEKI